MQDGPVIRKSMGADAYAKLQTKTAGSGFRSTRLSGGSSRSELLT
jgi:hypothetical protein